jgi:Bifunctional DNA primase/polymerase, N-terminal
VSGATRPSSPNSLETFSRVRVPRGVPPTNQIEDSLTAALSYQSHRLAVIPTRPFSKRAALRWRHWCDITQEPDDVIRMFGALPSESNVAILCGAASGNLAVVDCESRPAFNRTRRAVEAEGVATWQIETARGGHIYLRTRDPLQPAKTPDGLIELRSGRQYVLAPPSVHPSGHTYRFVSRTEEIALVEPDQLGFLGIPLRVARPVRQIPSATIQLLRRRDFSYPSRSEQEQAIVQGLVNARLPFKCVLSIFLYFPAADKFQGMYSKNPGDAVRWLRGNYEKAMSLGDSLTVRRIKAMRDWAVRGAWRGRTGITDRRVFLSHLSIAKRVGHTSYTASLRELAEVALVKVETVSKANKRLISKGLLRLVVPGNARRANRFTLLQKEVISGHSEETHTCEGMPQSYLFFVPEALAATRNLGRTAPEIYRFLEIADMSAVELASHSGRSPKSVRTALKRMAEIVDHRTGEILPLVEKRGKRWGLVQGIDLNAIARAIGTDGLRKRMHARHERERFKHRFSLEIASVVPENTNPR